MGKYVEWTTYKGKRILFLNAAGLSDKEYMAGQDELKNEIIKEGRPSMVLVDATKTQMSAAVVKKAKEVAAATKDAGVQDGPSAIVGLTGIQRATAQLFSRGMHFSSSLDEARDWLLKEDDRLNKR